VPHPRLRERAFVLRPLADIDSNQRDPVTGATVRDMLAALGDDGDLVRI
jgi:2-amino-4-hydroxy-6-hydroxymethyldihydropteridine diphosphokinase